MIRYEVVYYMTAYEIKSLRLARISIGLAALSLLATAALTILLIRQNKSISLKQLEQQKEFDRKQDDYEEKQMKLDQRPDKIKAYETISQVYKYCEYILMTIGCDKTITYNNMSKILKEIDLMFGITEDKMNFNLLKATLFVSNDVKPIVIDIRDTYLSTRKLVNSFIWHGVDIYKEEKIGKEERIEKILDNIKIINDTKKSVHSFMEEELSL